MDSGDALIGRTIEGRYRIDSKISAGGMGTVYRATRLLIGDEAAVKVLHDNQVALPESAERFRREAQAAARLKHPNAVTIYDFGISNDGLYYLVMDLIEGESVRSIIKKRGPFTPSSAAEIITQVCAALDEAHRQGIIHRDIKPDNIMVYYAVGGLRVKVLDFGIAKLRDQTATNLTQVGSVVGTPHYMSPEQCLGEELDHRADIYSLGIVLYEMLCGVVPFNSPISTAVVVQHVQQAPPPLRMINPAIPAAVEKVVLHALEKQREARPDSAGALAAELSAALNGRQVFPPTLPNDPTTRPTTDESTVVMTAPSARRPVHTPPPLPPVPYPTPSTPTPRANSYPLLLIGIVLGGILVAVAVLLFRSSNDGETGARTEGNQSNTSMRNDNASPTPPINVNNSEASLTDAERIESKIVQGTYLSESELSTFSLNELDRLRNTVFARHGRAFKRADLQRYFDTRPWYSISPSYSERVLSAADQANVNLIKAMEKQLGR